MSLYQLYIQNCFSVISSVDTQKFVISENVHMFAQLMCGKGSAAGCYISTIVELFSLLWFSAGQEVCRIPLIMTLSMCVCVCVCVHSRVCMSVILNVMFLYSLCVCLCSQSCVRVASFVFFCVCLSIISLIYLETNTHTNSLSSNAN